MAPDQHAKSSDERPTDSNEVSTELQDEDLTLDTETLDDVQGEEAAGVVGGGCGLPGATRPT
jgi:hypothetical protein